MDSLNLREFLKDKGKLREAYERLRGGYLPLPPPEAVEVKPWREVEAEYGPRPTVLAVASSGEEPWVSFKFDPPSLRTFLHELVHLCPVEPSEQELHAYNLNLLLAFVVENPGFLPKFPVLGLFKLTKPTVLKALERWGLRGLEEYYEVQGVIPHGYKPGAEGVEKAEPLTEEQEVKIFLTELIAGLPYFEHCRALLKAIVEEAWGRGWTGALRKLKYASVQLQRKLLEWRARGLRKKNI